MRLALPLDLVLLDPRFLVIAPAAGAPLVGSLPMRRKPRVVSVSENVARRPFARQ
jgi:hypothetical protein